MAKRILTCTIMTSRFCGRCLRPHTVELFATFSVSDVKPFFTCCVLASNTWNCVGNVSRAAIRSSPLSSVRSGPNARGLGMVEVGTCGLRARGVEPLWGCRRLV